MPEPGLPDQRNAGPRKQTLQVGGFESISTRVWPGHRAALVLCQGCGWHCQYCDSPDLRPPISHRTSPTWPDILRLLERQRGPIDGVLFSGGEPLFQRALGDAVLAVRELDLPVALDTSGALPERLAPLLNQLSWIALDIKSERQDYDEVTGVDGSGKKAWKALDIIMNADVPVQCRTTVHWRLMTPETLRRLAVAIAAHGVEDYRIQFARPNDTLADHTDRIPPALEMDDLWQDIACYFHHFEVVLA